MPRGQVHKKFTPEEDDRIRAGSAAGESLNSVARELGRSPGSISQRSDRIGVEWASSAQTAAANKARRDQAEEIRSENELRFAVISQRYMDKMEAPFTYIYSTGVEAVMPEPVPGDQRNFMQIAERAHRLSQDIADRRSGGGLVDTTSMLARMGAALGVERYVPTDDDGDGDDDDAADVGETDPVDS